MWKNGPIVTSCTSFSLHLISVMFQNFLDQLLLLNLYGIITYDSTLTFVGMKKLAFHTRYEKISISSSFLSSL